MNKFYLLVLSLLIAVLVLTSCAQANPATPTTSDSNAASPTGASALDGKTLLETRCTACHSLARVASAKGDAAQWQQVVDLMIQKGAQLNADEEKVLVEYLAANFK